ncbi:MAG: transposase [Thermodesulfovibrio sp.]|nr:transposase [Thermodesulfovibrio sp.]
MTEKSLKIKKSLLQTKLKRQHQMGVTYKLKIQAKTKRKKLLLNSVFTQAKWLYNFLIFNTDKAYNANKLETVLVKVGDSFKERQLSLLGSQIKQEIGHRLIDNLKGISILKKNGSKIGVLKPKKFLNSVPLKQYGVTYKLDFSRNRIYIQKLCSFRILGLKQIPPDCDIASAVLLRKPNGFYVHVTTYQEKKNISTINKPIGIDFGVKDKINLSNGLKIDFEVPESKRLKLLQNVLSRKKKNSKNREKIKALLRKEYQRILNIRRDCQNRIIGFLKNYEKVMFQDDNIKGWHINFGRQVQHSGVGTLKSRLCSSLEPIILSASEPTTKECFLCGNKREISLSERYYICDCSWRIDRDINSALNILKKGFNVDPNHILSLDWAEVTPVEWKTTWRILGHSPYIRLSIHDEAGSSRIYP